MPFLSRQALESIGFKRVGRDVQISDAARFHRPSEIEIGDFSRIDDFVVISAGLGGISIGRNVHIAPFCLLVGKERIVIEDFAGLSARVSIFSSSDDYSGAAMTNPTVPEERRRVQHGRVTLGRHVIVGAGAVILPGVSLGEGAAVGALSLVHRAVPPFMISMQVPLRRSRKRARGMLAEERVLLNAEVDTSKND